MKHVRMRRLLLRMRVFIFQCCAVRDGAEERALIIRCIFKHSCEYQFDRNHFLNAPPQSVWSSCIRVVAHFYRVFVNPYLYESTFAALRLFSLNGPTGTILKL